MLEEDTRRGASRRLRMLRERWQGCVFLLALLLSNASGM